MVNLATQVSVLEEPADINRPLPKTIGDLKEVANLLAACAWPACGHTDVRRQSQEKKKKGMAVYLKVTCSNCNTAIGTK